MRVINLSNNAIANNRLDISGAFRKVFKIEDPKNDPDAEKVVIETLQRLLDNQYVMLRSVPLDDPEVPIPLVLVGPQGVRMIYARSIKGVFRAKEDAWEEMDDRTQRFKITRPNLLLRSQLMGRAVDTYLAARNFDQAPAEVVLVFTDPGIHVDTVRPIIRVVQADALDRFGAGMVQSPAFLEKETIQRIVNVLGGERLASRQAAKTSADMQDAFSFKDLPTNKGRRSPDVLYQSSESPFFRKIPLTKRQLAVLGLMVLVNIIILSAFVFLILLTS
jgi:hypothetical protein